MERAVSDFYRVQALASLGCNHHCTPPYTPSALRCFESAYNGPETRTWTVFHSSDPVRLGEDLSTRYRALLTPSTAIQCLPDTLLDKIRTTYLIVWTYASIVLLSAERTDDVHNPCS
jgi:hypothetical protein